MEHPPIMPIDAVARALDSPPYPVIAWGLDALRHASGIVTPAFCARNNVVHMPWLTASLSRQVLSTGPRQAVMIVLEDAHIADASQRLRDQGFRDMTCSFGMEPEMSTDDTLKSIENYCLFDSATTRFFFTTTDGENAKLALIPSSYAHISAMCEYARGFHVVGGLLYPIPLLLKYSLVETLRGEDTRGPWTTLLTTWAYHWVFSQLGIAADMFDEAKIDPENDISGITNMIDAWNAYVEQMQ